MWPFLFFVFLFFLTVMRNTYILMQCHKQMSSLFKSEKWRSVSVYFTHVEYHDRKWLRMLLSLFKALSNNNVFLLWIILRMTFSVICFGDYKNEREILKMMLQWPFHMLSFSFVIFSWYRRCDLNTKCLYHKQWHYGRCSFVDSPRLQLAPVVQTGYFMMSKQS